MTYSLSDIKQLPSMRMEETVNKRKEVGSAVGMDFDITVHIKNLLRKQILSELTTNQLLKKKKLVSRSSELTKKT